MPMAIPGMVLGLAYIFFFNNPYNCKKIRENFQNEPQGTPLNGSHDPTLSRRLTCKLVAKPGALHVLLVHCETVLLEQA
jgi:ABC-type Fe3+ transport system permease subunit